MATSKSRPYFNISLECYPISRTKSQNVALSDLMPVRRSRFLDFFAYFFALSAPFREKGRSCPLIVQNPVSEINTGKNCKQDL